MDFTRIATDVFALASTSKAAIDWVTTLFGNLFNRVISVSAHVLNVSCELYYHARSWVFGCLKEHFLQTWCFPAAIFIALLLLCLAQPLLCSHVARRVNLRSLTPETRMRPESRFSGQNFSLSTFSSQVDRPRSFPKRLQDHVRTLVSTAWEIVNWRQNPHRISANVRESCLTMPTKIDPCTQNPAEAQEELNSSSSRSMSISSGPPTGRILTPDHSVLDFSSCEDLPFDSVRYPITTSSDAESPVSASWMAPAYSLRSDYTSEPCDTTGESASIHDEPHPKRLSPQEVSQLADSSDISHVVQKQRVRHTPLRYRRVFVKGSDG